MNLKTPVKLPINWNKVLIVSAIAFAASFVIALMTRARAMIVGIEVLDFCVLIGLLALGTYALIKRYGDDSKS